MKESEITLQFEETQVDDQPLPSLDDLIEENIVWSEDHFSEERMVHHLPRPTPREWRRPKEHRLVGLPENIRRAGTVASDS
ncbi:unnamed protein product [Protopolystoma xenopodis]|uniref:Uncharacterized protein n=1 Tax=Protopolystoma xenopodis TaxID=117903 RepID=A0A3S5FBZ0_9PLAT|nr:unnamed protein product [Protopolystoma xenopodis]